jgi:bacteriorhodopsin
MQDEKCDRNSDTAYKSFQDITFKISIVVQIAVLITSIVFLAISKSPELLQTVLIVELVVQCIELLWYACVTFQAKCGCFVQKRTVPVYIRYVDWVLTVPIMLFTLYGTMLVFENECASMDYLYDIYGVEGWIAVSTVSSLGMLFVGFLVEYYCHYGQCGYNALENGSIFSTFRTWVLISGFFPLAVAFIPHIVRLNSHYTTPGLVLLLFTITVWMCYGIVAILCQENACLKNGLYNILDLISKNLMAVLVSIITFNIYQSGDC